jgi:dihydrofolate reductase
MISIVVAADKNGVIGRENKIPWRLRDDLVMLRNLTLGHTVILGRKTYQSMEGYYDKSGRPMPGRTYIVVSREGYTPSRQNAKVVSSIDEALELANTLGDDAIFTIGGGGIFAGTLPFTDRIYLTEVQAEVAGDVFFPKLNMDDWREVSREHHTKDDRNQYDYDVIILERHD